MKNKLFEQIEQVNYWQHPPRKLSFIRHTYVGQIIGYLGNNLYHIEFILTGSNANLLSTELSTYITGRYIEISIFPFSFDEYLQYYQLNHSRESLIQYLEGSGLPELFFLERRFQKISYL